MKVHFRDQCEPHYPSYCPDGLEDKVAITKFESYMSITSLTAAYVVNQQDAHRMVMFGLNKSREIGMKIIFAKIKASKRKESTKLHDVMILLF